MKLSFKKLFQKDKGKEQPKEKVIEAKQEKPVVKADKTEKPPKIAKKQEKAQTNPLILASPHVTEKATAISGQNQYMFKVLENANKTEIRKAVEAVYNVDVVHVHIINVKAKKRRLGKSSGWKKGYKKAMVKIAKGQKIEALTQ